MKLYTEEQVKEAFNMGSWDKYEFEYVINSLTPIELPSDEKIDEYRPWEFKFNDSKRMAFESGAKWMRDKILNKNK